jgi:putative phosphoribosyl transferase
LTPAEHGRAGPAGRRGIVAFLPSLFRDRVDAGSALAGALEEQCAVGELDGALVLALPRGGVPVAAEIARAFDLELDVIVVRKLGVPGHEELAMGAIASGDVVVRNHDVIDGLGISERTFDGVLQRARSQLVDRERRFGKTAISPPLVGRTIVVVDDGVATGATMRAAVASLRMSGAGRLVIALPVAPVDTAGELARLAERLVCLHTPEPFGAVGGAYDDFTQTTDVEVRQLLQDARDRVTRGGA